MAWLHAGIGRHHAEGPSTSLNYSGTKNTKEPDNMYDERIDREVTETYAGAYVVMP